MEGGARIIEFPRPAGARPFADDPLAAIVTAADHVVSALDGQGAVAVLAALSGATLTPDELEAVAPLQRALSWLLDAPQGTGT